ncbi:class I SAM-dependent methyltransferase [Methanoculleus sp. FWC-SCC3]|uniref:Class I SAM-dependent methyltransferase n=1 Tax=Methanoculleus methanifontis TaxID=2584086 RepID=A0ABT8M5I1_9EURY|nr:methyltransferase domain-containing protein [Methanoculleus sp. FWC-SCC3]MDN7013863.1 class I SAM-dependent methyltransferase [Methanoculleus sp. FWC-SCC3]
MINFRARAKVLGWILLNNIIGKNGQKLVGTGGSNSARYCYSVWMRHLVSLNQIYGMQQIPAVVAEIGPGDSLGTGFAALLSGSDKYYSLDTVSYCNTQKNIKIFDEIVELFQNKEDIPNEEEFPKINPKLNSYSFPDHLFSDSYLHTMLSDDRIAQIRQNIASVNSSNGSVYYYAPWCDSSVVQEHSVDFLFSQAVLEHVDDLPLVYNSMKKWLKKDGTIVAIIDFKSHGTSVEWNGHWEYSDLVWKIIRGRAPYLINRSPLSHHLKCLNQTDFELIHMHRVERYGGIQREKLAERFKNLTESDLSTSGVYLIFKNRNVDEVNNAS